MERIGIDLDGVLNRISWFHDNLKIPWWLLLWLIFVKPNKKTVEILKKLDEQNIIIVSARPKQLEGLTRMWLRYHKIPFSNLFCVGLGKGVGQRKLEVINQLGIEKFIDNDEGVVNFLRKNFVNASTAGEVPG